MLLTLHVVEMNCSYILKKYPLCVGINYGYSYLKKYPFSLGMLMIVELVHVILKSVFHMYMYVSIKEMKHFEICLF